MGWRKRPVIYEIHTPAWLADLSARYRQTITLGSVPPQEWDALAGLHIDAVWFMGVWQRSPAGIAISNANGALQEEFHRALPDYATTDNIGSAYCIRSYTADERFGGAEGLAHARQELAARKVRLLLDYVPNHLAPDHPWVETHPEYFLHGTPGDLANSPLEFIQAGGIILANGRDPHFAAWHDVVQVNAFRQEFRAASVETLMAIAAQCDGMRCDMPMLMLNAVFAKTWGERAGAMPQTEFWSEVLPPVKEKFPGMLFIAEAYWDLEYELMQLGFDYCYDKRLYDRLARENAPAVRTHLLPSIDFQDRLVRFVENHDEPRAAAIMEPLQERAAALVVTTTPGAKLLNEGQLEGRKIKTPVFFARRAAESKSYDLSSFYRSLLKALDGELFHNGEWELCECSGWSDNPSNENVLAWTWRNAHDRALIVINYSARRSQAMVRVPWQDLRGQVWRLSDSLNGDVFIRDGNQMCEGGLFVDLDAWRFHFLSFEG